MSKDQRTDLLYLFALLGIAVWFVCSRLEYEMPSVLSGDSVSVDREYEDLMFVLPPEFPMDGYCVSGVKNGPCYLDWEKTVHRYVVQTFKWGGVKFSTGEQDSFGPLSRIMTCLDNEGRRRYFIYG